MIVKAKEGLVILHPHTGKPLPSDGLHIEEGDLHWARLERDGDVTIGPDPATDPTPTLPSKADAPAKADDTSKDDAK